MKKWVCFIMCLVLTSCAVAQDRSEISSNTATSFERPYVFTINGNISYFNTSTGTSTDDGYYFLEMLSDGTYHIKYIDYNTFVETVLCENTNCFHMDETCNGRGESLNNVPHFMPFGEKLLAVFLGSINPVLGDKNAFPRVELLNATGSDRILITLLDDYLNIDSTFATDDKTLYLLATKTDSGNKSTFKEFIKIDVSSKVLSVIYTFNEKENIFFETVADNKFVFKKIETPFDEEKSPQSSEEWENMFAQQKHELFFINQYGECETIKAWFQNELKELIVNDEMIYFTDNKIHSLNLTTGIENKLTNDLEHKLAGYEELTPISLLNDHLLLHTVIVNVDGTVKYANLIVNFENSDVYESKLYIKDSANINNPLYPLTQLNNDILVVKEIKTIQEIVEAKDGTRSKQEKMVNSYALTNISDFLNNVDNSKAIERIA